jgi:hypothetical protein
MNQYCPHPQTDIIKAISYERWATIWIHIMMILSISGTEHATFPQKVTNWNPQNPQDPKSFHHISLQSGVFGRATSCRMIRSPTCLISTNWILFLPGNEEDYPAKSILFLLWIASSWENKSHGCVEYDNVYFKTWHVIWTDLCTDSGISIMLQSTIKPSGSSMLNSVFCMESTTSRPNLQNSNQNWLT